MFTYPKSTLPRRIYVFETTPLLRVTSEEEWLALEQETSTIRVLYDDA